MAGAEDEKKMPLLEHLVELRRRLLYSAVAFVIGLIGCAFFAQDMFNFLAHPMQVTGRPFQYTDLTEPFFMELKLTAFGALCVSFPLLAGQIWAFVAPGLYKNERQAFLPFLIATPIMFIIGATFFYVMILPLAIKFFASFQMPGGPDVPTVVLQPKIGEYISFVMTLIFAFGLCFELPVLLTLLARVGIVSAAGLKSKRRYAIVGVFAVSAVVTPPDVFSQLSLAFPLLALYEISIFLAGVVEKKRAQREAELDAELNENGSGAVSHPQASE
jgi:sec-independent protein translocase protein TatC